MNSNEEVVRGDSLNQLYLSFLFSHSNLSIQEIILKIFRLLIIYCNSKD